MEDQEIAQSEEKMVKMFHPGHSSIPINDEPKRFEGTDEIAEENPQTPPSTHSTNHTEARPDHRSAFSWFLKCLTIFGVVYPVLMGYVQWKYNNNGQNLLINHPFVSAMSFAAYVLGVISGVFAIYFDPNSIEEPVWDLWYRRAQAVFVGSVGTASMLLLVIVSLSR